MKNEQSTMITRNATPRMMKLLLTPTLLFNAFATGGIRTELNPYVAVAIPPTSPRLSGKNLTVLLIVQPYAMPRPKPARRL